MSITVVRRAQMADLAAIVRLGAAVPEITCWAESEYAAILGSEGGSSVSTLTRQIFVAESDCLESGGICCVSGFVLVKCVPLPGAALAEIENLAVDVRMRRRGLGRALMQSAIDWARVNQAGRLQLEVRASNSPAMALYMALGFAEVGRRSRYYSQPVEDAVLLDLQLR